jgi:hypothetical protein
MNDEAFERRLSEFVNRATSIRAHFVGFLCFWSMWVLSVPFWKAVVLGLLTTCIMVFELHTRIMVVIVLALAVIGAASFAGISLHDVKQFATDLRLTSG